MPPKRSTAKPASAWPTPETTKNTLITAPTCVKVKPNSRISITKSGGITKWKKCDVPWAKPTSEMTAASWRRLGAAGLAADIGFHCILPRHGQGKTLPLVPGEPFVHRVSRRRVGQARAPRPRLLRVPHARRRAGGPLLVDDPRQARELP